MDNGENQSPTRPISQKDSIEDEINLFDYISVIFKHRRMIVLICAAAVIITAIISLSQPKIYSATTSIVPPVEILQRESGLTSGLGLGTNKNSILSKAIGVASIADMYAGILESRAIADAIIDRFDLMKAYETKGYWFRARAQLKKNTTIEVSDEGILRITVEDSDPNRATAMANAYVEELDQQNKRLSGGQATSKRIFLETRLAEIEEKLSKIENILSREAKIQEMLFELLTREYEIAKIEEAKSMPTIQILDKAIVPEMRLPRGTIKRTALAGAVSLMLAIFITFAREYLAKICEDGEKQEQLPFKPKQQNADNDILSELESRRKIVAAQRKKRTQENESHSQEAQG